MHTPQYVTRYVLQEWRTREGISLHAIKVATLYCDTNSIDICSHYYCSSDPCNTLMSRFLSVLFLTILQKTITMRYFRIIVDFTVHSCNEWDVPLCWVQLNMRTYTSREVHVHVSCSARTRTAAYHDSRPAYTRHSHYHTALHFATHLQYTAPLHSLHSFTIRAPIHELHCILSYLVHF